MMDPRAARLFVVLSLVWPLWGCQERLIEVDVSGLSPQVESLDAAISLPGRDAAEHRAVTRRLERFYLSLDYGVEGPLRVHVDGLGKDGCRVAAGDAPEQELRVGQGATLPVQLMARGDGCKLAVDTVGDGSGQLFATTDPVHDKMGRQCAGTCAPEGRPMFSAGQQVTLRAVPMEGSFFAGWSGGCSGTDACVLTIAGAPQQVRAAFGLKRVCDCAFCWESPLPQGNDVRGLWGSSADDIWAVGPHGNLLNWNGSFWVRWPPMTTDGLNGVFGVLDMSADMVPRPLVWAVGDRGTILSFDGKSWQRQDSGTPAALFAVWASGPQDVWAVGAYGKIVHFDGGGWEVVPSGTSAYLGAIWGSGPADIWAAGGSFGLTKPDVPGILLHYNGKAWTSVYTTSSDSFPTAEFTGLGGSHPDDVWAVGRIPDPDQPGVLVPRGVLFRYNGAHWSREYGPSSVSAYYAVWDHAADDVWLAAQDASGGLLVHYDGTGFTRYSSPASSFRSGLALWGSGPDDVWSGGAGNTLRHWNGLSWVRRSSGLSGDLLGVAGNAPENIYAVGQGTPILHFDGQAWNAVALNNDARLNAVWVSKEGPVWAVGAAGAVIHLDPMQATLTRLANPLIENLLTVWGSADDDVWAAGEDGTLLHKGPDGLKTVTGPAKEHIYSLWGSGPADIWAAGAKGTIIHYDGTAWQSVPSPTAGDLFKLWGSGPADIWAMGVGDDLLSPVLLHYAGAGWESDLGDMSQLPADLGNVSFLTLWGNDSSTLWASTGNAILRRQGDTWRLDSRLTGGLVQFWGTDSNHLFGVGPAGVIVSRTGSN